MGATVESAMRIIEATGPVGAYIAAAIVALFLGLILFAHSAGLFESVRRDRQSTGVMDRLIAQYDKLAVSEAALRAEAERIEAKTTR